jgi:hypothetical protein
MTAANYDATNAADSPFGGVVHESIMNRIWDISHIPLPLTDMISKGTHDNQRTEWTEDELGTPSTANANVDGIDVDQDDSKATVRLGNFTQTALKEVQISTRLQNSNTIGNNGKMSYQIAERQKELRRDVEAQMMTYQASVAGDGLTVAGISAGLGAQLKTNVDTNAGTAGGFNTSTGVFDAPIPGVARALSETLIRDILQQVYVAGGNTDCLMGTPAVIRNLSEYLFSDTARVATLTAEQSQASPRALTAYGSVNVFVTDFGQTVKMIDNRIQQPDDTDESTLYFIDPSHLTQSFLYGYKVEPLAKTGLSEKRLMSCDYALKCYSEKSQGAIYAIDETAAVVA